MSMRNLSPQQMFQQMAREHTPQFHFAARESGDFESWKEAAWPQVLATLGDFPPQVEPNPQLLAEWRHNGLRKQRWVIDVGPHISANFLINYPGDWREDEKRPAILCWHGHGAFGKEPVMGNDSRADLRDSIRQHNYNYGEQMAQQGFITFAIDWIGGGERNDGHKPHFRNQNGSRDWCNLYYLHATMFGMTSISINVAHGQAATSFASTLPGVDADKLGVMGLSGGGTMTLWSALCDPRLKAVEIICYSDLWAAFGMRDINYCGMQVAPGLYKLVDLPDLQGLLAPRPLLIDIGAYDNCFLIDTSMRCYEQLQKIYAAAGASEQLHLDLAGIGHAWPANKSVEFFTKYLR